MPGTQPAPHSSVLRRTGGLPAGARLGGPQRPWLPPAAACRRSRGQGGRWGREARRAAHGRSAAGGRRRWRARGGARGRSGRATANRRRRRAAPRSGGPGSPRVHSGGPRAGAGRAGGVRAGRAARSATARRRFGGGGRGFGWREGRGVGLGRGEAHRGFDWSG